MPITSEIMQYVPRKAPEGLIAHVIANGMLPRAGIVYRFEWVDDFGIEAMLEQKIRKVKAVRITCSNCGESSMMNYVPAVNSSGYGFMIDYEYAGGPTAIGSYDDIECPMCGTRCGVRKASTIGAGKMVTDECRIMSACLAETPGAGRKPLCLIGWRIQRKTDRDGYDYYDADPLDAYVFDGSDAAKLTGSRTEYSGNAGYYLGIKRQWDMPKTWRCDWTVTDEIYGLTKEMIESSSVANCKLYEFMDGDGMHAAQKWPVVYMRLWQRYPQAENLVHRGAGHILAQLILEHGERQTWAEKNKKGSIEIPELDWSETRPAQMLRLNKAEFRAMLNQCWDYYHWKVYITAKMFGDRMEIPEDIVLLHKYGAEDIEEVIGRAPVGKCLRYLFKQYERFGCCPENEETDPIHAIWDNEGLGARELADYWRMAEKCKWNLADPAVKWPRDLAAAHDRAAAAWELEKQKGQTRSFRRLVKKLADYRYESNGILIRPAASLAELKTEGKELHHCVGSYGDAHLAGKSIFFVRRAEEPDKPWFTLQLDVERCTVLQNHGNHNCARTKEVQAFEDEWVAWLRAGRPRNEDGTPVGTQPTAKRKKKRGEAA